MAKDFQSYEYKKEYIKKYLSKMDEFRIRVPAGDKDKYKAAAASVDKSLNQFVIDCLEEKIESMQTDPATNEEPKLK